LNREIDFKPIDRIPQTQYEDIVGYNKRYTEIKQQSIYKKISAHIRFFNVSFESVDSRELTVLGNISKASTHILDSRIIEEIKNDLYNFEDMHLVQWDLFNGKDYYTVSFYLFHLSKDELYYKSMDRKEKAFVHAFFIMRFARLPKNDWIYFTEWAYRFKKSLFGYFDNTSKKVYGILNNLKDTLKKDEARW
jgi:hypothetical protein